MDSETNASGDDNDGDGMLPADDDADDAVAAWAINIKSGPNDIEAAANVPSMARVIVEIVGRDARVG